jgi:hypothetical protein
LQKTRNFYLLLFAELHRYAFLLLEQTAGPIGQYEDGAFEETRANFRLNEFRTINELSSQASAFNYFGVRLTTNKKYFRTILWEFNFYLKNNIFPKISTLFNFLLKYNLCLLF